MLDGGGWTIISGAICLHDEHRVKHGHPKGEARGVCREACPVANLARRRATWPQQRYSNHLQHWGGHPGIVIITATNGAALQYSIEIPFTLPDDHPSEPGDHGPCGHGWVDRHTLIRHAVTGAAGVAAAHAQHQRNQVKRLGRSRR
jgi:hypothetical protein